LKGVETRQHPTERNGGEDRHGHDRAKAGGGA
jgi:hypothetical protein